MATAPSCLPPVSFHQYPTTLPVYPAMTHPYGVRVWWTLPAAGSPDISIPVPAMITADPNIARTGRCNAPFNYLSRRVYFDYHLLPIGAGKPKGCYQQGIRNYSVHRYSPRCYGRRVLAVCFGIAAAQAIKVFQGIDFL
jgi:hypothetical protein